MQALNPIASARHYERVRAHIGCDHIVPDNTTKLTLFVRLSISLVVTPVYQPLFSLFGCAAYRRCSFPRKKGASLRISLLVSDPSSRDWKYSSARQEDIFVAGQDGESDGRQGNEIGQRGGGGDAMRVLGRNALARRKPHRTPAGAYRA